MSEEVEDTFLEWVDGRAFAGWVEGRRPDLRTALTEAQQRALHRLRSEGGAGSLDLVDRICVRLSIHINEIPEWIWTDRPRVGRKPKVYSAEVKAKAVRMLRGGRTMKDVAMILDLPRTTVKNWKTREVDGKR